MNFEIVPITEEHIKDFWSAVDSVAREHKYYLLLGIPGLFVSVFSLSSSTSAGGVDSSAV